ncbi:MAG: DUF3849 domain-containing protein [Lachnospiraceae bacterium]|nr:DUF3849 domain-containing protein [Lachnospiraceae bacterium]
MAGNESVYLHDVAFARANGEIEQYHRSRRTNIDCKKAIESAVRENFDGRSLNHDAVRPVVEQFGAERVAHVLAATVRYFDWDGRFSRDNRVWAQTVPAVKDTDSLGMDRSTEYVVESHPAVLDGFIRMFREETIQVQDRGKTADGKRSSALEQLKADEENYLRNAEMALEDDYGMIDGILNNGRKEPEEAARSSVLEKLKSMPESPPQTSRHRQEKSLE